MNQTFSKVINGPLRYSSRKQIFGSKSDTLNDSHNDDLFRISAKIRSLQDDVRSILSQNEAIEQQNQELIQILQKLKYIISIQESQLQNLTNNINKQIQASSAIDSYQQNLKEVGKQIEVLNDLINQKNNDHDQLKSEKDDLLYENMRLKDQSNMLMYNENLLHQEIDQILESSNEDLVFNEDLEKKVESLINYCHRLSEKINNKKEFIQKLKKESNDSVMRQREKRIQLEFNIKLLKERKKDYSKKKDLLNACYDEQKIQQAIDDMLMKEDSLRQQIAQQKLDNDEIRQENQELIENTLKQINRERNRKKSEIKLIKMQTDILSKELENAKTIHLQISTKLQSTEIEGVKISQYIAQNDVQLFNQIKEIEEQNIRLQQRYNQLQNEVSFIKKQIEIDS